MELRDAIGEGLLGSDYNLIRLKAGEYVRAVKNLTDPSEVMYRAPSDMSLFGRIPDPLLRKLPPSLATQAKRIIDMEGYAGLKAVQGFVKDVESGLLDAIKSKITKRTEVPLDTSVQSSRDTLNLASDEDYSVNESLDDDLIGHRSSKVTEGPTHLNFSRDTKYQDKNSPFTGYKVSVGKGVVDPLINSGDLPDSQRNSSNDFDKDMALKFRPKEDTIWFITIDRFTQNDGNSVPSALPEFPIFRNEFNGDIIEYAKWLPAFDYSYTRRGVLSSETFNYGWGNSFNQVGSISRGNNISISIEDDREHTFSRYAKDVINRSANYENGTLTYWECLLHRVNIYILDKYWRVNERFSLLGLLVSDGIESYSDQPTSKLTMSFNIVGEITSKSERLIEEL